MYSPFYGCMNVNHNAFPYKRTSSMVMVEDFHWWNSAMPYDYVNCWCGIDSGVYNSNFPMKENDISSEKLSNRWIKHSLTHISHVFWFIFILYYLLLFQKNNNMKLRAPAKMFGLTQESNPRPRKQHELARQNNFLKRRIYSKTVVSVSATP